jgi:hypothetical protein
MPLPEGARKNLAIQPPRAFVSGGGGQGQVAVLAVSATPIAIDLTRGFNPVYPPTTGLGSVAQGAKPLITTRNYLTISADTGADVGVIFGPSVAAVSGGNAPVLATTGSLVSNVYTGVAGTCWRIPAGTSQRFLCAQGVDNAVGIVGSGAGVVRIYQSSPDDA